MQLLPVRLGPFLIPASYCISLLYDSMIFALSHLLEILNGANGMSDIEGKVTRVGASERGKRASFNGANGMSDIEGKVTRVGASEWSRGDASDIDGQNREVEMGGST